MKKCWLVYKREWRYLRVVGDMGAVNLHACRDGIQQRVSSVRQQPGREPSVRSDMKKCWLVYKREWPERVHA
jgi:hypothetical protein